MVYHQPQQSAGDRAPVYTLSMRVACTSLAHFVLADSAGVAEVVGEAVATAAAVADNGAARLDNSFIEGDLRTSLGWTLVVLQPISQK